MAETDWKITKSTLVCGACQAPLGAEDQPYFSALLQTPEGLTRRDYCGGCFQDKRPAEVFYFWKARPAAEETPAKRRVAVFDVDFVLDFFKRLEGEEAAQKVAFRYILALMLTRKKVLVFEQKKKDGAGRDIQIFREKRGGVSHQVIEPALTETEITEVSAELGVLLGLTPPKQSAPPASPAPAAENAPAEAAPASEPAAEAPAAGPEGVALAEGHAPATEA